MSGPLMLLYALLSTLQPLAQADVAAVRSTERAWLDAYRKLDSAAMRELLEEGFTITYPDGRTMGREAVIGQIERMRKMRPTGPDFTTEGVCASGQGDTIVLTGIVTARGRDGSSQRNRYTDTYVRRGGKWLVKDSKLADAGATAAAACRQ